MRFLWSICLLMFVYAAGAQKLSKADKKMEERYRESVFFLADDELEGRRTGTAGEKLASDYIMNAYKDAGLKPYFGEAYLQAFEVREGKALDPETHLKVNDRQAVLMEDFFPLAFSPDTALKTMASQSLNENNAAWFVDLKEMLEENVHNPHFDLEQAIIDMSKKLAKKTVTTVILYNTSALPDNLAYNPKNKMAPAPIPVIYITKMGMKKLFADESITDDLDISIKTIEKIRYGHNVAGYIDNRAPYTVILGAHYDHLGYGEDHNSLYTGKQPMIHNGADDNASGTAALIELARWVPTSKLKKYNYLFVSFSGEELGLFGSKYFTEHSPISNVDYMINMDMVGRLNDSTHGLNIGGFGTSPQWQNILKTGKEKYFKIKIDSSGSGPSDHTSFYRKDIPVLFFFTGTHSDYHKPTDDADKINYTGAVMVINYIRNILMLTDGMDKLAFTKTREAAGNARTSFKVSLGIMPDYTYSGNGVRVDGVSEGRAAEKAGVKTGDVIFQLGDHKFTDVQTYMEALSKFNKGDSTQVKWKRGEELLQAVIVF
ncbi:MAG: M28 family peptidase [Ferruginibacter sp.]